MELQRSGCIAIIAVVLLFLVSVVSCQKSSDQNRTKREIIKAYDDLAVAIDELEKGNLKEGLSDAKRAFRTLEDLYEER